MAEEKTPSPAVTGRVRDKAADALCDYFAADSLSLPELEERLDRTHRAATLEELEAVFSDIPGGGERFRALVGEAREGSSPAGGSSGVSGASGVRPTAGRHAPVALYDGPRDQNDVAVAVLGGSVRKGRWIPADRTFALAVCGGVQLDFREAALPAGVTEVHVLAVMGGVEIIVPPGLPVEARGIAVMGGFEHMDEAPGPGADRPVPMLRIRGVALMGGVDVSIREPGETAREAKRRRRRERRLEQRERKLRERERPSLEP